MKKIITVITAIFISICTHAESAITFKSTTDFAYYTKSDFQKGDTHFAPVTGPYSGLEAQESLTATWKLSEKIAINGIFSFTPVNILPKLSFTWSPLPFLDLSTGGEIGTGWEFIGIKAMSVYEEDEYKMKDPFKTWYYKIWASPTLKFDAAFLWPGDWHHIVAVAAWEAGWSGLINAGNYELYQFQATKGKQEGWGYKNNYIIGYQMPLVLKMVALKFQQEGYFENNKKYKNYKSNYCVNNLGLLGEIGITSKDSLIIMTELATRRSFKTKHDDDEQEPLLIYKGDEWYFNRIAFSYTHKF